MPPGLELLGVDWQGYDGIDDRATVVVADARRNAVVELTTWLARALPKDEVSFDPLSSTAAAFIGVHEPTGPAIDPASHDRFIERILDSERIPALLMVEGSAIEAIRLVWPERFIYRFDRDGFVFTAAALIALAGEFLSRLDSLSLPGIQ